MTAPSQPLPAIPAKRYFTIGEVSELCGVKAYVLRYWEQEFTQLKPMKRRGNRRYYQHHEVLLIRRIRDLLYEQGFTISGARNQLIEAGAGAGHAHALDQSHSGAHEADEAGREGVPAVMPKGLEQVAATQAPGDAVRHGRRAGDLRREAPGGGEARPAATAKEAGAAGRSPAGQSAADAGVSASIGEDAGAGAGAEVDVGTDIHAGVAARAPTAIERAPAGAGLPIAAGGDTHPPTPAARGDHPGSSRASQAADPPSTQTVSSSLTLGLGPYSGTVVSRTIALQARPNASVSTPAPAPLDAVYTAAQIREELCAIRTLLAG